MENDVTLSSDRIVEIGQAFWKSKALLSAVELNLFTVLAAEGPLDTGGVCERVGLHDRGAVTVESAAALVEAARPMSLTLAKMTHKQRCVENGIVLPKTDFEQKQALISQWKRELR